MRSHVTKKPKFISYFQNTYKEVQTKRAEIEELNARRDAVSEQMDMRMAQINKVDGASQSLPKDSCE